VDILSLVRQTIVSFCVEFKDHPYLCYTEHGQHARFYTILYNALPEEQRFITWHKQKVCILQKEYPTASKLGKPQRQHWDIAVLSSPPESAEKKSTSYDYLKLDAAIEFGMNEAEEHIEDDIARLGHMDANVRQGFIVHLYRLSEAGAKFSERDWSPNSPRILTLEQVASLPKGSSVEIFYGITDSTGNRKSGLWCIKDRVMSEII
jgi:hypothetical protein